MNIAIIYGGRSGEHEISLISAAAVVRGIKKSHKIFLIGITKDGKWFLQDDSLLQKILSDSCAKLEIIQKKENSVSILPGFKNKSFIVNGKSLDTDIVFPVLHGTYGEDGTIQGLFEMADIPYVGSSHLASAIAMDKEKTKMILQSVGIPVVPYFCMKKNITEDSVVYDAVLDDTEKEIGYPMFVKPCCAGSSNGASKAKNRKELSFAIMEAFCWDNKILIEKAINAREIECSVTGNSVTGKNQSDEDVTAYIPGEISTSSVFYDYDSKYNDPNAAKLLVPANLSENDLEKIRKTACAVYKALDITGLARVDFFIDKDTNAVYLNEVNTMPGITPISLFPKMCDRAGLCFEELTELLIQEGISRYNSKNILTTQR